MLPDWLHFIRRQKHQPQISQCRLEFWHSLSVSGTSTLLVSEKKSGKTTAAILINKQTLALIYLYRLNGENEATL
jgi:hypothetical protein